MKNFIETKRLILRELHFTDLENMYELHSNVQVHQYLGNKTVNCREQAAEIIDFVRQQYIDNGIGRWAMVLKSTNEFVGWSGLKFNNTITNNQINYHDLGYRLLPKFWGNGYATESAIASLNYGFDILNLNEVFAAAHINNLASNYILKKIGFQLVGVFMYENEMNNWYVINRSLWETKSNAYFGLK
jgi:RimJ/RimL family protein N-acetyltransferase